MTIKRLYEPDMKFSDWLRTNLKDSKILAIMDLDFILYDKVTKEISILEHKNGGAELSESQKTILNILDKHLRSYEGYKGVHVVKTNYKHGKIPAIDHGYIGNYFELDGKQMTEKELISRLDNFAYDGLDFIKSSRVFKNYR